MNPDVISEVADVLLRVRSVVLASHVNPDGDAVGSLLAVTQTLNKLGIETVPILVDGVPEIYRWVPGADLVQMETQRTDFDAGIACDSGALIRIGSSIVPLFESVPLLIDIDHHVADGTFGKYQIVDEKRASTCELVYDFILELERQTGKVLLDPEIAQCLMVGIITDTGSFKYPNVTSQTLEAAAQLTALGAHPAPINERVYESRSFANVKLLGRALETLQRSDDGRVAWSSISSHDFAEFGATDEETEGIVSHIRAVRGVDVAIFFREIPGGKVRISLRGRDGVSDVNKIANVFGGGGHRLAAGCSLDPPLGSAVVAVVNEAKKQLGG